MIFEILVGRYTPSIEKTSGEIFRLLRLPCETGYPGYPGYPGEFLGNLGDFLSSSLRVAALTKIYNIFYCVHCAEELESMRL